jgi:hypothetical protein
MNDVFRRHRALTLGVLRAVAVLAIGALGIVNLLEGDWFIGGLLVVCVLLSLPSLVSIVRRVRREERTTSSRADDTHARQH